MEQIEPLEHANRRIHTISSTEIMSFEGYCDISIFVMGGPGDHNSLKALHSLRNAVISRRADVFVDMATYSLQLHQLSIIKPKKMDNHRTLAISFLVTIIAFVGCLCLTWLRIERLEGKVQRMQQKIGYYESDNP